MRSRGYEILESLSEHLDEIGCIFAHNDAMARGAVDYLHEHGRVPGRDILVCSFGGGADMRALLKDGMVQVVAALDDETLAALTVEGSAGSCAGARCAFYVLCIGCCTGRRRGACRDVMRPGIHAMLRQSFFQIIAGMLVPTLLLGGLLIGLTQRYDSVIADTSRASELRGILVQELPDELEGRIRTHFV